MSPRGNRNWRRSRDVEEKEVMDKKYYIFCEGEKTEPKYFESIKELITSHPMYKNKIHIKVEGVGAETLKVLEASEDYVAKNKITDAEVWIVYDKDSFLDSRFNAVEERIEVLNSQGNSVVYKAAWSNQCIEYWFILHFSYYHSNNDRSEYIEYLNREFIKLNYGKYKKNDANIFKVLYQDNKPQLAVKFAEKRLKEESGNTSAKSAPATKVHLLYSELSKYFPKK